MQPVPRNENGWPTIEPSEFTDIQLVAEAMSWRSAAIDTLGNTVSNMLWEKYCDELVKRGLLVADYGYTDLTELDWVRPYLAKPVSCTRLRTWWRKLLCIQ